MAQRWDHQEGQAHSAASPAGPTPWVTCWGWWVRAHRRPASDPIAPASAPWWPKPGGVGGGGVAAVRRRTAHPENYARELGTHRAQRARGLGRQVRPVPWRPKVRFHLGERVCRWRKRATCCPLGIATEGQHAASGCNFGAQRPALSHRGIGASELGASRPSGAHSPEGSNLAGIHLRETPAEARGRGCTMLAGNSSLQGPPGTAPECALHGVAPRRTCRAIRV